MFLKNVLGCSQKLFLIIVFKNVPKQALNPPKSVGVPQFKVLISAVD